MEFNQPQEQLDSDRTMMLRCPSCGAGIGGIPQPMRDITNGAFTASITFIFPQGISCPNCFKQLLMNVHGVELRAGFILVLDPRQGRIVTPPPGVVPNFS